MRAPRPHSNPVIAMHAVGENIAQGTVAPRKTTEGQAIDADPEILVMRIRAIESQPQEQ